MYALLRLPVIRARVERAAGRSLDPMDLARIAVLVFVHDAGKLHPGFQAKARPDLPRPGGPVSHASAGLGLLELAISRSDHPLHRFLLRIEEWGPAMNALIPSIFAHHGRPVPAAMTRSDEWTPLAVSIPDQNGAMARRNTGPWLRVWHAPRRAWPPHA
jgi:CRISPR-associated endonuclease/helicase Cas3